MFLLLHAIHHEYGNCEKRNRPRKFTIVNLILYMRRLVRSAHPTGRKSVFDDCGEDSSGDCFCYERE